MYKCGWNGCEKAYGTLNHLNAHVTMQSHGTKRTPEGTSVIILWCYLSIAKPARFSVIMYILTGGPDFMIRL